MYLETCDSWVLQCSSARNCFCNFHVVHKIHTNYHFTSTWEFGQRSGKTGATSVFNQSAQCHFEQSKKKTFGYSHFCVVKLVTCVGRGKSACISVIDKVLIDHTAIIWDGPVWAQLGHGQQAGTHAVCEWTLQCIASPAAYHYNVQRRLFQIFQGRLFEWLELVLIHLFIIKL